MTSIKEKHVVIISWAFTAISFILIACMLLFARDVDSYTMSSYGRIILSDGIPYYDPYRIEPNFPIVLQEWLYCVYLALLDSLFVGAYQLMTLVCYAILFLLFYKCCKLASMSVNRALLFSNICLIGIVMPASVTCQVQLLTLILLTLQLYIQEKVVRGSNWKFLLLIALLVLIEMQIHAAMWFLHFCLFAAYIVPIPFKSINNRLLWVNPKDLFKIAMIIFSMTVALFINPYGFDSIKYTFSALLGDSAFDYWCNSNQLSPLTIRNALAYIAVPLIVSIVYFVILVYSKRCYSGTFWLTIGLGVLCFIYVRNTILAVLILIAILFNSYDFSNKVLYSTVIVSLAFLFLAAITYWRVPESFLNGDHHYFQDIELYIKNKDAHIYTNNDVIGTYFEYDGYMNVYWDAMPEKYMAEINGNVPLKNNRYFSNPDVATAAVSFQIFYVSEDKLCNNLADESFKSWVNYYAFDYMLVSFNDTRLLSLIEKNCNYRVCTTVINDTYVLLEMI